MITRIIPSIQAKVEHIIAVLPPSDDDPMGVTDTPKRSTVLAQAKGASVVLIKVDPGVHNSPFHPMFTDASFNSVTYARSSIVIAS